MRFGSEIMSDKRLLNEREVYQGYGLSIPWLRKARFQRTGPAFVKIGRLVRYRISDIERFLSERVIHTCPLSS
jgi:predicted DNA-binding transcriptional regulator AlpA